VRLSALRESDCSLDEQYEVDYQLVDTADFGVPQRRLRVIFTGFRRDTQQSPVKLESTHSRTALLIDQWVTGEYWERHEIKSGAAGEEVKRVAV
jgi:DNA (cytosine-5)-methyltransferase 1